MPEQITLYLDTLKVSPYCSRVEIALLETGASYTTHGFDVYSKPAWFAQINPLTGKIPSITYGGPDVHPEEPSPLSFKLTESLVILEFLADVFPDSSLLPPASNPTARARVRTLVDIIARDVEAPVIQLIRGNSEMNEKIVEGLEKFQALFPDPEAVDGGEFAAGKNFTNADCAIAPILALIELITKTDLGRFEPGTGKKLGEALSADKFKRLQRYKKAIWGRESVKNVIDLDRLEEIWVIRFTPDH